MKKLPEPMMLYRYTHAAGFRDGDTLYIEVWRNASGTKENTWVIRKDGSRTPLYTYRFDTCESYVARGAWRRVQWDPPWSTQGVGAY